MAAGSGCGNRAASVDATGPCSAELPASGCAGPAPAISDCFGGDFFADCNGTGSQPAFACTETTSSEVGDCRWFANGCVAAGYTISSCPSDDLCCCSNWPFQEDVDLTLASDRLYSFGFLPWDRDRNMTMEVAVDGALTAGTPAYTCTGDDPVGGPLDTCTWERASARFLDTLVLFNWQDSDGGDGGYWAIWIEVDHSAPARVARLCQYRLASEGFDQCPAVEASCATSGTITLGRIPASADDLAGLPVAVEAMFENGFHLTGSFALP
jgi:hypothetical protein